MFFKGLMIYYYDVCSAGILKCDCNPQLVLSKIDQKWKFNKIKITKYS